MKRGRVVPEAAVAWSNGRLQAQEYFAEARRRALANAIRTVRYDIRANGSARGHRPA